MIGFSVVAAVLAWGLSVLIGPGNGMVFDGAVDPPTLEEEAADTTGWQNTLLNFVSKNVFEAMSTATMVPIIIFALLFASHCGCRSTRPATTGSSPLSIRSSRSCSP